MSHWPVHGKITGPIVLIGFGSIGRGVRRCSSGSFSSTEPLHRRSTPPNASAFARRARIESFEAALTEAHYREIPTPLLTKGEGRALSSIFPSRFARSTSSSSRAS